MALDGIYLYSLVQDLKKSITNSKIDKINQPEKDEIFVTLRKDRKNVKKISSFSFLHPQNILEFTLQRLIKPTLFKHLCLQWF